MVLWVTCHARPPKTGEGIPAVESGLTDDQAVSLTLPLVSPDVHGLAVAAALAVLVRGRGSRAVAGVDARGTGLQQKVALCGVHELGVGVEVPFAFVASLDNAVGDVGHVVMPVADLLGPAGRDVATQDAVRQRGIRRGAAGAVRAAVDPPRPGRGRRFG